MKANELMIGDFLRFRQDYPFKKLQGKIVKVEGIRGRVDVITVDTGNFYEYEHPDWLEPIPLTPEILEKNGAKHSIYERPYFDYEPTEDELNNALQYYPFHGYNLGTNIQVAFYPKEIRVEVFGQDFVDVFKIRGNVYVHELQHALRLCGIQKEIEL